MDPTKIGTCLRLVITVAVSVLLSASSATFTAEPRAGGKAVRGCVSRYPEAVAPVREDVAAVIAREQRRVQRTLAPQQSLISLTAVSPAAALEFDTIPYCNLLNRPDSAVAAGPDHLVTAVNFCLQVQDLDGQNANLMGLAAFFPGVVPTADITKWARESARHRFDSP